MIGRRDFDGERFGRLTVDRRPDVVLFADNFDFLLIDGDFLTCSAVRFEYVL